MKRHTFDAGSELQVVRTITEQGLSVRQVCKDLNLGEIVVRRWLDQVDAEPHGQMYIEKYFTRDQTRICQLETQNQQPRKENDI